MTPDSAASDAVFPLAGAWYDLSDEMRESFAGCPDAPRMRSTIEGLQKDAHRRRRQWARQLSGSSTQPEKRYTSDGVAFAEGPKVISFITRSRLRVGLSYDDVPNNAYKDAPQRRWHLSISECTGGDHTLVSEAEVVGWVLAGFPHAKTCAVFVPATAAARHAEIPIE